MDVILPQMSSKFVIQPSRRVVKAFSGANETPIH